MMTKEEVLETWSEPIKVLNHGHVALEDYMGTDACIVKAARASYQGGTKKFRDDRSLLRFLMRHKHYSPFSMAQIKIHFKVPLFINTQQLRHDRFHWNLASGRYSEMEASYWFPEGAEIRIQDKSNKQCSSGQLDQGIADPASEAIQKNMKTTHSLYKRLLEHGVPREQARTILPVGQYTEGFATANLGDWLLFLSQRLAPDAQYEIRVFAEVVATILEDLFPITMEAFKDYQLGAVTFTAHELQVLSWIMQRAEFNECLLTDPEIDDCRLVNLNNLSDKAREALLSRSIENKRERIECWKKLKSLFES